MRTGHQEIFEQLRRDILAGKFDGLKRIRGTTIDMGCYSFNAPGLMLMLK